MQNVESQLVCTYLDLATLKHCLEQKMEFPLGKND